MVRATSLIGAKGFFELQIQREGNFLVNTTKKNLEHKKKDGLEEKGRICYWYGKKTKKFLKDLGDSIVGQPDVKPYSLRKLMDDNDFWKDKILFTHDWGIPNPRIFFRVNQKIKGSFELVGANEKEGREAVYFFSESWIDWEKKDG